MRHIQSLELIRTKAMGINDAAIRFLSLQKKHLQILMATIFDFKGGATDFWMLKEILRERIMIIVIFAISSYILCKSTHNILYIAHFKLINSRLENKHTII